MPRTPTKEPIVRRPTTTHATTSSGFTKTQMQIARFDSVLKSLDEKSHLLPSRKYSTLRGTFQRIQTHLEAILRDHPDFDPAGDILERMLNRVAESLQFFPDNLNNEVSDTYLERTVIFAEALELALKTSAPNARFLEIYDNLKTKHYLTKAIEAEHDIDLQFELFLSPFEDIPELENEFALIRNKFFRSAIEDKQRIIEIILKHLKRSRYLSSNTLSEILAEISTTMTEPKFVEERPTKSTSWSDALENNIPNEIKLRPNYKKELEALRKISTEQASKLSAIALRLKVEDKRKFNAFYTALFNFLLDAKLPLVIEQLRKAYK